jgi:hypothetical protein
MTDRYFLSELGFVGFEDERIFSFVILKSSHPKNPSSDKINHQKSIIKNRKFKNEVLSCEPDKNETGKSKILLLRKERMVFRRSGIQTKHASLDAIFTVRRGVVVRFAVPLRRRQNALLHPSSWS